MDNNLSYPLSIFIHGHYGEYPSTHVSSYYMEPWKPPQEMKKCNTWLSHIGRLDVSPTYFFRSKGGFVLNSLYYTSCSLWCYGEEMCVEKILSINGIILRILWVIILMFMWSLYVLHFIYIFFFHVFLKFALINTRYFLFFKMKGWMDMGVLRRRWLRWIWRWSVEHYQMLRGGGVNQHILKLD